MPPVITTAVIVISLAFLVPAIVIGWSRAARRRTLASSAETSLGDEAHPLSEGKDVVLSGIVRHFEDHDVAVKVSITQEGTETESSGSWSHRWTEIDRDIVVAPFLLELPNGQHVRVDPPRNVDVADDLDQKVWIDRNKRVLSAELVPGEKIHARGRLERSDVASPGSAYRDVAWGWSLGPTDGQMLLSSEPLGAGLRERARFHARYAWIAVSILLASQLSLVWYFNRLLGDTIVVEVASKRFFQTTDSDGDTHDHYEITLAHDSDLVDRSVEIDEDDYEYLDAKSRVPVRRATATNWNLGESATISILHGVLLFAAPYVFWIAYAIRRRASRPWFRRRVDDSGSGRLPDPE